MDFHKKALISFFVPFFIVFFAVPSFSSSSLSRFITDLSPIYAGATKAEDGNFILNVGSSNGIKAGDIFSIVAKGEPFYAQNTKKIIGYREKVVSKCQVINLSDKSAICKPYLDLFEVKGQLRAIRFSNIKAAFFVNGRLSYPELTNGALSELLPNIEWLEPASGPVPVASSSSMSAFGLDMIVELGYGKLKVFGPGYQLIREYEIDLTRPFVSGKQPKELQGNGEGASEFPSEPLVDFSRAKVKGTLNEKVLQLEVIDLDGDGNYEVVYLLKDRILISPYMHSGSLLGFKVDDFEAACNFSLFPGKGWLSLNVSLDDAGLDSRLFNYDNDKLQLIQEGINLWLQFISQGCKFKEVRFVGQSFERMRMRGQNFFQLFPTEKGIEYGDNLDYPSDFSIQSATTIPFKDNCALFYVSFDGFLKVYLRGSHIWTSLWPIVEEERGCGPQRVSFVKLGDYILFSGLIKKGATGSNNVYGLFVLNPKNGLDFKRIDVNLSGRINGMSLLEQDRLLIGVSQNIKNKPKTILYEFDAKKILEKIKGTYEESSN